MKIVLIASFGNYKEKLFLASLPEMLHQKDLDQSVKVSVMITRRWITSRSSRL